MATINKKYWNDFYKFWDEFVVNWCSQREKGIETLQDEDSQALYEAVNGLVFDELPNPYFGDPRNGVDAVIINLNPGGSEKDENKAGTDATQFYSNLKETDKHGNGKGWLMWRFVHDAKCSYKRFVGDEDKNINWSQLNPELRWHRPEVCGVKWWQGLLTEGENGDELYEGKNRKVIHSSASSQRIEWARRIYNNPWIDPAKVFALELCPYHSKSFDFDSKKLDDDNRNRVFNFIADHVIHPALMAVVESKLDFAVAVGKTTAIYLEQQLKQISGGEYKIEARLEREWWEGSDDIGSWNWPTTNDSATGKKRLTHRKYCLFALRDKDGRMARFLVTAAPGGNTTPGKDFEKKKIESELILKYVRGEPLTKKYYDDLQSLPNMRWWKNSNGKIDSSKGKAKQAGQQKSKLASSSRLGIQQLYSNLWNGFSKWCKDNNKRWIDPKKANEKVIYLARGRKYLFKMNNNQLCLGIYCNVAKCEMIRRNCEDKFRTRYENVNWGNPARTGHRTILLPIQGDWRNPSDDLFRKMAEEFEAVRRMLGESGLLQGNGSAAKRS